MFKGKPGSGGLKGRHTLIFYLQFWKISITHSEVKEYKGVVIDVEKGEIVKGNIEASPSQTIFVFEDFAKSYQKKSSKYIVDKKQSIGFLVPKKGISLTRKNLVTYILERFPKQSEKDISIVESHFTSFTPASYKSLLQKIIRFRSERVSLSLFGETTGILKYVDNSYPSDFVLSVTLMSLIINPGSFVPDIQRFVSGKESAFKRLIVSVIEDSYIENENIATTLTLTSCAYLSQRLKGWNPSSLIINKFFDMGIQGYQSKKSFFWSTSKGEKYLLILLTKK